tara:strand:- start:278 stop:559 length:282 start_codon:yes stop_codon:yes gene_type:complete
MDKVLAAPPLIDVAKTYKDNPQGIVTWAKAPGRKRKEFAPMPAMGHVGDEKLTAIAEYILKATGNSTEAQPAEPTTSKATGDATPSTSTQPVE